VSSLVFSLGNTSITIDYDDLYTVPLSIHFEDGSILVIIIVFTGDTPAKSADMQRSETSQGQTFEDYFAYTGPGGISNESPPRSSGAEARALFGRWPQCQMSSQIIGRDNEYLVTTGTKEDGSTYVVAIELIGSHPIYENQIICDTTLIINPPPM